jgi:hypothetical protein
VETRQVARVPPRSARCLAALRSVAPGGGTLIGADVVLGIPEYVGRASGSRGFLDWLATGQSQPQFFEAVARAADWSPWRPFWRNPYGQGSQKLFFEMIRARYPEFPQDHRLSRKIDGPVHGKPPTCVSGMPGTVGSGTLEFWKELAEMKDLLVWPFAGSDLPTLLTGGAPVIVETYPALCYGIVLGESLPASYIPVAKTNKTERSGVLQRLTQSPAWDPKLRIADDLWNAAYECEDDFDALFMALALYRLVLEGQLNPGEAAPGPALDPDFEGGIVGSWCVTKPAQGSRPSRSKTLAGSTPTRSSTPRFTCPLTGCQHVFSYGRGGWDGHVASPRNHLDWHPEVRDGAARKALFRSEFPEFFRR